MKYPNRALTPEQVREIRRLRVVYQTPVPKVGSIRSLAKMFSVSEKVIIRICRRHSYKEIE